MQKKLTITIDEDVYSGLYRVVGRRKISRFIESLVRPYVVSEDISSTSPERDIPSSPAFITEGHRTAHVIMTIEDYFSMAAQKQSMVELLAMPEAVDFDFDPPSLDSELYRKSELS